MYTKISYQLLNILIVLGRKFHLNTIVFDLKRERFYSDTRKITGAAISTTFFIVSTLFSGIKTLSISLEGGNTYEQYFNYCYCCCIGYCILTSCQCVLYFHTNLLIYSGNLHLNFCKYYSKALIRNYNAKKTICGMPLTFILLMAIGAYTQLSTVSFLHQHFYMDTPVYFSSVIPTKLRNNFAVYIAIHLVMACTSLFIWIPMLLVGCFAIFYIFSIFPIVQKDFRGKCKLYRTKSFLHKDAFKFTQVYRCVEIIHKLMLSFVGPLVLIQHSCMGNMSVFCLCSIILQWNQMDNITRNLLLLWGIGSFVVWSLALEIAGRFHEDAKSTIQSWKYINFPENSHRKYIQKFKKACRPLKIGSEGYFTIRRLSVLKFARGVIKASMRALLTLGNK